MPLELHQQLKLAQQVVMTTQMQQAIRLLQLSHLDLVQTIQNELLENPFLEEHQEIPYEEVREPETIQALSTGSEEYDHKAITETDWDDYIGEFSSTPKDINPRDYEQLDEMTALEGRCAEHPTLKGHLTWQLRLSQLSEEQKDIGEIIIGNLDSSGFLQATNEEMAEMAQTTPEQVEAVRQAIMRFDPVGVASRTTQEALLTQIEVLGYDRDPILVSLIKDYFEDLENFRYKPILKNLQIDMEELKEYLVIIQSLEPRPCSQFSDDESVYISPDVYVYKVGDDFQIVLNDDGLPELGLSPECERLADKARGKEKSYFSEKLRSASWLIKSIHQRQHTLYQVVESIVRHQRDFFENGVSSLKRLILKDIAEDIGLHESNVSRVTANKYVATPFGVFELKYFFNAGLVLSNGDDISSESIKSVIKDCIEKEDKCKPLSDDTLAKILEDRLQLTIARRTIAKYRSMMDIPSSSQRKVRTS